MYNFPGEFFQSEQRAFVFSVFLFLYLASRPSILYCEQSNRERTRERVAKLFPAHSQVISRDFPSGELARRLSPASVWKRTGKGKLRRSRTRWAREEGRNGIYAHSPYFSLHTSCSRAPWYPTWQCCITLEPSTFCSNSLFFMRSFLARSQNCKQPENPAVLWCPFQSHLSVKWNINFEQYTR